ncbi:MAG: ABC transporter ATP-binding protein [Bacteroidales bacterium]|nr:ABC transporter ATP-binding protein [Candidatus Cacconaster merdequi]
MNTFRRILSYSRPFGKYWPSYLLLSILSVIFGVVNYALLGPLLTVLFENDTVATGLAKPEFQFTLDYFTALFSYWLSFVVGRGGIIKGLLFVCLSIVVTCFFSDLCRYLSQRILVSMKTTLMSRLRRDLFKKVSSLHVGYFDDRRKGDLLSSISNDVNEVQNSVAGSFHVFFREPILVLGFLAMLFYMSPKLTAISLVALPVSAFIVTKITRNLRKGSIETQSLMGRILSHFDEAVSGLRIIKAFNAGKYVEESFEQTNERHRRISRSVFNRQELASPTSEFLGISIAAIVLFYGGWLNIHGELGMTWQQFIVYIMFYWKVLEPAKAIANSYAAVQKGIVSGNRLFDILDIPEAIVSGTRPIHSFEHSIEFDHVTFSYGGEPVLKDICLTVPKGKSVAIVGPSGAGKSTMADLVPRFWDVTQGAVKIDGIDIKEYRIEDLVSLLGIVTQEAILFNDTVKANIVFGQEGATTQQVVKAAKVANADEFISKMENGYDTNIGDRGAKLSGGQRQRVAIARAVLKNPAILILDEATSALDTESERLVQEALTNLMENRTSLVIAHRLSTIRHADQIVVIQSGKIVEKGTHEELVAKRGLYSHLCELQEN